MLRFLLRYAMRTVSSGGVMVCTRLDSAADAGKVTLALAPQCRNGLTLSTMRDLVEEFETDQAATASQFHAVALDLALARRVAQLMRGNLEMEDVHDEIRLTARIPAGIPGHGSHGQDSAVPAEADSVILVVEDNPVSQRVLRAVLAKGDYNVECCSDGPSALQAASQRR